MLNFFEYFFYRIYDLYTRNGEKDIPVFYGISVLSVIHGLNIIAIVFLYFIFRGHHEAPQKWTLWIGIISFGLNYFYFMQKKRYRKIIKRYASENKNIRRRKGMGVLAYAVITFVLVIYLATVIRSMTAPT